MLHQVEDQRDLDARVLRGTLDPCQLIPIAIDEHNPPASALGISAQCLCEGIVDDALAPRLIVEE